MLYKNELDIILRRLVLFGIPRSMYNIDGKVKLKNIESVIILLAGAFDTSYTEYPARTTQVKTVYDSYFGLEYPKKLKEGMKPRYVRYFIGNYIPKNKSSVYFFIDDIKSCLIEMGWIDAKDIMFTKNITRQNLNIYFNKLIKKNLIYKKQFGQGYYHPRHSYFDPQSIIPIKKKVRKFRIENAVANGPMAILYPKQRTEVVKTDFDRQIEDKLFLILKKASLDAHESLIHHYQKKDEPLRETLNRIQKRGMLPILIMDMAFENIPLMHSNNSAVISARRKR